MKTFPTVAKLKLARLSSGELASTIGYLGGYAEGVVPSGGATYQISSLATVRTAKGDGTWVPDEQGDHTLANGNVAMLVRGTELDPLQFGGKLSTVTADMTANTALLNTMRTNNPTATIVIPRGMGYHVDNLTVTGDIRYIDLSMSAYDSSTGLNKVYADSLHLIRHLMVSGDINMYGFNGGNPELTFGGDVGYDDDRYLWYLNPTYNSNAGIGGLKYVNGSGSLSDLFIFDTKTNDPRPRYRRDLIIDKPSGNSGVTLSESGNDRATIAYNITSNELELRVQDLAGTLETVVAILGEQDDHIAELKADLVLSQGKRITLTNSVTTCEIICGQGAPNGAVTANVGSLYMQTDGAANNVLWVKETGTGDTGWSATA